MNLGELSAWAQQNKTPLLAAGGAGVVGLALFARKRAGGDVSTGGSSSSSAPADVAYSSGGQVAGRAYDSTASDLYSSLSPELSGIAQKLAELQGADKTPTPVPAAPAKPAGFSVKDGFYKMAGTPNVYQVKGGRIDYLTHKEYVALTKGQKVTVQALSKDNPIFSNGAHWLDANKQKTTAAPAPATASK